MHPRKPTQNHKPAAFAFMAKAFARGDELSIREMAREFDCSVRTAQRWFAEYDSVVEKLDWSNGKAMLQ